MESVGHRKKKWGDQNVSDKHLRDTTIKKLEKKYKGRG